MRFATKAMLLAAMVSGVAVLAGQMTWQGPGDGGAGRAAAEVAAVDPEAARVAPVGPLPLDRRVVLSGHSLTDPVPEPLNRLVRAAGGPAGMIDRSTIPGSPMDWRWNNRAEPVDARERIADYDVLVITERVSLSGTRPWHDSDDWALRWAEHAWADGAGGNGAEVLLYATWVDLVPDPQYHRGDPDFDYPWRERLDREFAAWEAILAHVNANRPEGTHAMRMIPATLVVAAVHDAIAEGRAPPELEDIGGLFSDNIHLSPLGAHLVALTHFAAIYGRDLTGLPAPWDVPEETWAWMLDLVGEVVSAYPGSGVQVQAR